MKVTVANRRPWLIHSLADCRDCDWSATNWQTAVKEGREHARKTGHEVELETGYAQTLNPKG